MAANDGMTSIKPHILRSVYAWILENNLTPHVLVNANSWGVQVPRQYVEEGKIVLNVEPMAVREFDMGYHKLSFKARFQGVSRQVSVPMRAVLAVFAAENGRGQLFSGEEFDSDETPAQALTNTVIVNPTYPLYESSQENRSTESAAKLTVIMADSTPYNDDNGGDDDGGGGSRHTKKDAANLPKKEKPSWLRVIK